MTPGSQIIDRLIDRVKELPPISRIAVLSISGLLVIGIIVWSASSLTNPVQATPPRTSVPASTSTPTSTSTYSPLIFGTNLQLSDIHDQVLTSQPTRNLLQQLHVRIMRVPMHSSLSEQTEVQAATDVKNLGASLDVVLEGPSAPTALQDDTRMIHDMSTLFGNQTVYYEFGEEQDLMGISASHYISSWNQIIPQLKALAPHGQFIGPVTYHYDQSYLQSFLKQAKPGPDAVSWHEYTCTSTDPQSMCLAHINDWSMHIKSAQSSMKATVGTTLPIMISEWNYAPDAHATDGKSTDQAFMSQWTQKAIQTLLTNHVFASMQYSCTNTAAPLITSNNTLSTQGTIFQQQYTQVMKDFPAATATPTSTAIAQVQPTPKSAHHTTPRGTVPPAQKSSPPSTPESTSPPSTPEPTSPPKPTPTPEPTSPPKPTPTPEPTSPPKPTPTPAPIMGPWPIVSEGATGRNVTSIQLLLQAHGYSLSIDGDFGPQTASTVKSFQSAHHLTVDGQVGPQTWPQLIITTSQGSSGAAVKALQDQLNAHGANLTVDGNFGPLTRQAVINFQRSRHLEVDGIAGPQTWQSLVSK